MAAGGGGERSRAAEGDVEQSRTAPYGFDAAKLRGARTAAGVSVARIARAVGVTDRAMSLYLAGTRIPRSAALPRLAAPSAPPRPSGGRWSE
ncbi:helix-turn-helix transcriptional regulator [Streptomyces sp. UMAF16]|nr:helix-turn-helix transcriptional regulator [Streptomyces sp. UMAF16]